jgi:hypothetical protein
MEPAIRKKAEMLAPIARHSIEMAITAGVKIAFSTDGPLPGNDPGREFISLGKRGMTPVQAIQSATIRAAELLETTDRGRLAPGLLADIVAVPGDPTQRKIGLAAKQSERIAECLLWEHSSLSVVGLRDRSRQAGKRGVRAAQRAARTRCDLGQAAHLQAGVQLAPGWHLHAGPHLQAGPQPQDIPFPSVATPIADESDF